MRCGILDMLGLRASPVARMVLGTGFDPMGFAAYAASAIGVVAIETWRGRRVMA